MDSKSEDQSLLVMGNSHLYPINSAEKSKVSNRCSNLKINPICAPAQRSMTDQGLKYKKILDRNYFILIAIAWLHSSFGLANAQTLTTETTGCERTFSPTANGRFISETQT